MQSRFMQSLWTVVGIALLSGAGSIAVNAVVPGACDTDGDSYITAQEAKTCTEERFEELSAGQQSLTQEQFGKAFPAAENPEQLFTETDQDGDGKVTREEWMNWYEQNFTAATEANQGRMPTADYESMMERYARPTPEDQNKQ